MKNTNKINRKRESPPRELVLSCKYKTLSRLDSDKIVSVCVFVAHVH